MASGSALCEGEGVVHRLGPPCCLRVAHRRIGKPRSGGHCGAGLRRLSQVTPTKPQAGPGSISILCPSPRASATIASDPIMMSVIVLGRSIPGVREVVGAFGCGEAIEKRSDLSPGVVDGA
jgi:hypothetical protein